MKCILQEACTTAQGRAVHVCVQSALFLPYGEGGGEGAESKEEYDVSLINPDEVDLHHCSVIAQCLG